MPSAVPTQSGPACWKKRMDSVTVSTVSPGPPRSRSHITAMPCWRQCRIAAERSSCRCGWPYTESMAGLAESLVKLIPTQPACAMPPRQIGVKGHDGKVGVPPAAGAQAPADQLVADASGVVRRQIELGVAEMENVDALAEQRFHLLGHLGSRPRPNRRTLGQRIDAIAALAVAAALGLDADLPSETKIRGVVHDFTSRRDRQPVRPGRGVGPDGPALCHSNPLTRSHRRDPRSSVTSSTMASSPSPRMPKSAPEHGSTSGARIEYPTPPITMGTSDSLTQEADQRVQFRHERGPARPETIVDVAKRDADQVGLTCGEVAADRVLGIFRQAQVEQIDLDARSAQGPAEVIQPERGDRRRHAIAVDECQHGVGLSGIVVRPSTCEG